jgi:hypothetical protein
MDVLLRKAESVARGELNAEPENGKVHPRREHPALSRLLAEATDAERRRVLLKLLADEEAKDQRPPERKQG